MSPVTLATSALWWMSEPFAGTVPGNKPEPGTHRPHARRLVTRSSVRVLCGPNSAAGAAGRPGAVLGVPLPLPDLTHSSSARGQEASAPQDTTHPGKIKNMKDKKHGSRDKSIVVLTARMTVESACRSTQVQAASDTGGSSGPPAIASAAIPGRCKPHGYRRGRLTRQASSVPAA